MSAPAYESMAKTLSPLAESSAAVDAAPEAAGVDDTVAADAPRRGSRTRKPTSRAAGLDPTEAATASPGTQQKDTRSRRKRKADDIGAEQEDVAETELGTVFEKSASDGEDDEDEKQYCICRGNDDGTFMISCERCQDWLVRPDDDDNYESCTSCVQAQLTQNPGNRCTHAAIPHVLLYTGSTRNASASHRRPPRSSTNTSARLAGTRQARHSRKVGLIVSRVVGRQRKVGLLESTSHMHRTL